MFVRSQLSLFEFQNITVSLICKIIFELTFDEELSDSFLDDAYCFATFPLFDTETKKERRGLCVENEHCASKAAAFAVQLLNFIPSEPLSMLRYRLL